MARVCDESPLARERGLEAAQHLVQRLAEPRNLVVGRRYRQALTGRGGRDLGRSAPHRLDRTQGRAREEIPSERSQNEHDRAADEQLTAKRLERVVAVLEPCADNHDDPLAAGPGGPRQELDGVVEAGQRHAVYEERGSAGALELIRSQELLIPNERGAVEDRPVPVEYLSEVLLGLDEAAGGSFRERRLGVLGADERCDVVGARAQTLIQDLSELAIEPDVEERRQAGEHERHGEREGETQAYPDRQPAQLSSLRNRYPTPRTVSIDARPNGRSIFSRR